MTLAHQTSTIFAHRFLDIKIVDMLNQSMNPLQFFLNTENLHHSTQKFMLSSINFEFYKLIES